jgi:small subunit ribosomal protein S1
MEVEAESIKKKDLKEFQDLLNEDLKKRILKEGSIIEARITEITPKWVQLDANAKSDSLVASSEFENLASLKVGDTVSMLLERIEDYRSGQLVLSRYKAILLQNWKKILEAYKKEEIVTGVVKSRTRGGYLAVVMGTNCFLPGSAISDQPIKPDEVNKLFNVEQKMRVVSVNESRMNCIVSVKEVHMKDKEKQMQEILKKIKVGDTLAKTDGFELTISALNDWAAWILISTEGASATGMMHVTQMSWSRLKKPSDILSLNQKIPQIKVIDIDKTVNPHRISLSLKDLPGVKNPFDGLKERYLVNKFYSGKVVKILKFGAFIQLEDSIQALLHQSECDPFNRMANVNDVVSLGKQIEVRLLKVDEKEKKISVSLIPVDHPWDNFLKKFSENQNVSCEIVKRDVRHLHLNIEGSGIPSYLCLCYWKNLSYNSESVGNLKNFSVKQKIKAKILNIDSKKMRVFLGVREASSDSDPFKYFSQKANGSTVVCTVKEVLSDGIRVSPGNEKNNLLITIKKNHLAKSPSDCRPEIFRQGDVVKSMIINLDKKQRKVDLSIKELEKSEEAKLIKKFGKDGSSSGKVLKDILGKVFSSKKDNKDKK